MLVNDVLELAAFTMSIALLILNESVMFASMSDLKALIMRGKLFESCISVKIEELCKRFAA